jgi:hypothetical protein
MLNFGFKSLVEESIRGSMATRCSSLQALPQLLVSTQPPTSVANRGKRHQRQRLRQTRNRLLSQGTPAPIVPVHLVYPSSATRFSLRCEDEMDFYLPFSIFVNRQ